MKHSLVLGALAALAAGPVLAGNIDEPTPEPTLATPVAAPSFTAPDWSGGYVGAQLGYGTVDTDNAGGADGDGVIGGLHAGYSWDLGNWVVGGEADFDFSDISLSDGAGDLDSVGRLKVKAGYDLGSTLVYGTAGAAFAEADLGNDTGYVVGAGVTRRLTDNILLGGEVLYHGFDDYDNSGIDVEATTATARLSFQF